MERQELVSRTLYMWNSTALGREDVIRGSFAANAFFLIRGFTLHSLFSIPVEAGSRYFVELRGDSLKKIPDSFNKVLVVTINEYSMVSLDLLGKIESRSRQAKGRRDVPYGGVNVILVGDPGQLLPVGGTPLYGQSDQPFFCKEKLHIQISRRLLYCTRSSGNKRI